MVATIGGRDVERRRSGMVQRRGLVQAHLRTAGVAYRPSEQAEIARVWLDRVHPSGRTHGAREREGVEADVGADIDGGHARLHGARDERALATGEEAEAPALRRHPAVERV